MSDIKKTINYLLFLVVFTISTTAVVAQDYVYEVSDEQYIESVKVRNTLADEKVEGVPWHSFSSKTYGTTQTNMTIELGDLYAVDKSSQLFNPENTLTTLKGYGDNYLSHFKDESSEDQPMEMCETSPIVYPNTICLGSSILLTGLCYTGTIQWYSNSGLTTSLGTGTSFTVSPTSTTTYYASCVSGTCKSVGSAVTITVSPPPAAPSTSSTATEICQGQSTQLLGFCSGGLAAYWYHDSGLTSVVGGNPNVSPNSTTTYYAVCLTVNGTCVSVPTPVVLTVNAYPSAPSITPVTICAGASTTLTGTCSIGTVRWYTNSGLTTILSNITVAPVSTTTYYAACMSGTCKSTGAATIITIASGPVAPSTIAASICTGGSTTLTGTCTTGTPTWYNNSGLTTLLSNTTVSPASSTTYYAACISGTCKSNATSTTVTVTPGLTLTAASFSKTNTQNSYKTDGRISINSLTSNTTYRIGYNFNGVPQSLVSYTANASGILNITGFTPGSYSSFNVLNPSGCSSGIVNSTQIIN